MVTTIKKYIYIVKKLQKSVLKSKKWRQGIYAVDSFVLICQTLCLRADSTQSYSANEDIGFANSLRYSCEQLKFEADVNR